MLSQFIKAEVAYGAFAPISDYLESPNLIRTKIDQTFVQQADFLHYENYISSEKQGSDTNGNYLSPNGPREITSPSQTNAKKYNQISGKTVSVYYTEWAVWKDMVNNPGEHTTWNTNLIMHPQFKDAFQPEAVTHVQFGFIPICGSSEDGSDLQLALCTVNPCVPLHSEKTPLRNLSIACNGGMDYEVVVFDSWGNFANGKYTPLFYTMEEVRRQYTDLKVIGSIGGWTLSKVFYMLNDDTKIEKFANSVAKYAVDYQFFDGFDLDYEVPGGVGGADDGVTKVTYQPYDAKGESEDGPVKTDVLVENPGSLENDKVNYVKIVKKLREKLDKIGAGLGKTYELTIATNCDPDKMANTDFSSMHQYLDAINMMTYDFSGAWTNGGSDEKGHYITNQANLYNRTDKKDMSSVEQAYNVLVNDQNVPSEKLALGVAFYARGWKGIGREDGAPDIKNVTFVGDDKSPTTARDWFDSYTTAQKGCAGVVQDGVLDYTSVKEAEESGKCEYFYDECAQAPSLYCQEIDELYTYDNPRSVFAKADFVKKYNMKGLFAWAWDQDDGTLLNAMNEGLGNTPMDNTPVFPDGFPERPGTCAKGPGTPAPTEKPPVDMTKALKVYGGRCGIATSADATITCKSDIDPLSFNANDAWIGACAEWFPVLIADATNGYPDVCSVAVSNFVANHPNGCDCGMSG